MKKILLMTAALALTLAPAAFAAIPTQVTPAKSHVVLAAATTTVKKQGVKKQGKKAHRKGKKVKAATSKPAVDAGNTSKGESLPPVTDSSAQ